MDKEKTHMKMISDDEGVSLEFIQEIGTTNFFYRINKYGEEFIRYNLDDAMEELNLVHTYFQLIHPKCD